MTVAAVSIGAVAREWSYTYGSEASQEIDLNARIEAVSRNGGGRVVVPPGRWVSDPVILKSNVELHLESGSELVFTDDLEKYLPAVRTSYKGVECYNYRPLIYACTGVRLEGFAIRDSPFWCVHLLHCADVDVRGLSIRAFLNNSDGIDVECSRNVLIEDCSFDQGDDVIVLKAGKDRDGRRRATPTENVTIRHCRAGSGHGFLVVGSECSGGIRNVTMEDCVVDGTLDTLFKVKTSSKRGGFVHDVVMRRVTAKTIISAVVDLNAAYALNSSADGADEVLTGIEGLTVEDVSVASAGARHCIRGDVRRPMRQVVIRNLVIAACGERGICKHADVRDLETGDCGARSGPRGCP